MDSAIEKRLAAKLGKRIAAIRLNADMTQQQLAEMLGIGDEAVSRIERGAVTPSLPRLFDIAEAFRIRVDELLLASSPRMEDEALAIAHRIERLSPVDRDFVIDSVGRMSEHLLHKAGGKRARR